MDGAKFSREQFLMTQWSDVVITNFISIYIEMQILFSMVKFSRTADNASFFWNPYNSWLLVFRLFWIFDQSVNYLSWTNFNIVIIVKYILYTFPIFRLEECCTSYSLQFFYCSWTFVLVPLFPATSYYLHLVLNMV